jgi:hypothetical protein
MIYIFTLGKKLVFLKEFIILLPSGNVGLVPQDFFVNIYKITQRQFSE